MTGGIAYTPSLEKGLFNKEALLGQTSAKLHVYNLLMTLSEVELVTDSN